MYGIGLPQLDGYEAVELDVFVEGVDRLAITTVNSLARDLLEDTSDTAEASVDRDWELSVLEVLLDSERKLLELEVTRLIEMELSDLELFVLAVCVVREDSDRLERLREDSEDSERLELVLTVEAVELELELEVLEVERSAKELEDEELVVRRLTVRLVREDEDCEEIVDSVDFEEDVEIVEEVEAVDLEDSEPEDLLDGLWELREE